MNILNSKTALGIKAAAIVFATLSIYNQDLTIVANDALRSELMSHILAVPFLFAYLIYRKRKVLRATIPFKSPTTKGKTIQTHEIVGALLCLTAFLFYWHGSYTFNPLEHHMVSLPIFTAGLVLAIFNPETLKVLAFPLAFLLFLVPPPLEILYTAGTTLSTISSEAAYTVLKTIGLPVTLTSEYETPVIILTKPGTAPISFAVDIGCAGLYSLTGFTIFAVFVAYIARGASWRKAAIFLAGLPLIYALNITRIITIVSIGFLSTVEVAMQAFHLLGGWVLIFAGTLILLTVSEKVFKIRLFTSNPRLTRCNYCNQNPESEQHFCGACGKILNPMKINLSRTDLGKIIIVGMAAILIMNLQVPVFALTEGPAEVTIQTLGGEQTTTEILPEIAEYTTRFIYRDTRFEEIAKQDASLTYGYVPTDKSGTDVWVTIEVAKTRSSLHPWEVCLITYPLTHGYEPKATQLDLRDVQILQNPPITARYFAFQDIKSNGTQVVLYWYGNAYFNTGESLEQEHVKISLIAFPSSPEDVPMVEDELLPFAEAIASYWEPIRTWSQISLLISQNGITLMATTIASLATLLTYQITKGIQRERSNRKIYDNLALEEEKLILQAVHQAKKERPTTNRIALHYEKLAGKPVELNTLTRRLQEAGEVGLVKQVIASEEDEPILTWKNQFAIYRSRH